MKEPIFKAVAMPMRVFWAPMAPAMINFGTQFAILFILLGFYSFNPLWIIASVFIVHGILVFAGVKEPHLSQMLKSQGPFIRSYSNIYPERGRKLSS